MADILQTFTLQVHFAEDSKCFCCYSYFIGRFFFLNVQMKISQNYFRYCPAPNIQQAIIPKPMMAQIANELNIK